MIIIMAGMMGTGKSTYTEWFSKQYPFEPQFETVVENPYLELFYQDPKKYAPKLQDFFLKDRVKAMEKAIEGENTILDRSIFENEIFNSVYRQMGYLTENDYQACQKQLEEEIERLSQKRDDEMVVVYLEGCFETVLKRIAQRDNTYEQAQSGSHHLEYYRHLYDTYHTWYENYNLSPKIKIDIDQFDIVNRPDEVIDYIQEQIG